MRHSLFSLSLSLLLVAGCASHVPMSTASASAASKPSSGSHYHVVRHIPIGGEGGWDYLTVDADGRRLFLSRGTHVMVMDLASGKVVGDIPHTDGVHGIALAPGLGRAFISNGRSSSVMIVDLANLNPIAEVKTTGERPDAIIYEPFSKRVFTFNAGGKNTTAIDAASGIVAGTIALGGKPEFAASDGAGRLYVNIEDTNEVVALDPVALTVASRWPLAGCDEPSGLAIDRIHGRLFSGCGNKIMAVSDIRSGKMLTSVPIGEGVDANAFDPATGLAFSSNGGAGTLTVARMSGPDRYEVVENVPTARGARTMALDESTHYIYLVTAQFGPTPDPTAERPHPRPPAIPGTFEVIEVAP